MRSHRIQKTVFKDTPSYTFSGDFSLFRNFTVKYQGNETNKQFIELPVYTQLDASKSNEDNPDNDKYYIYGKKAVEDFSEEIKYQRRAHLKKTEASKFQVDLGYEADPENTAEVKNYKCVTITFDYKLIGTALEEKIIISVKVEDPEDTSKTIDLQIKDLDLDSDVTEYLFRFTRGLEWGSETHGILDCNPNDSVNKGVYFTLNAPFNENINWGNRIDKRLPIFAYRIY